MFTDLFEGKISCFNRTHTFNLFSVLQTRTLGTWYIPPSPDSRMGSGNLLQPDRIATITYSTLHGILRFQSHIGCGLAVSAYGTQGTLVSHSPYDGGSQTLNVTASIMLRWYACVSATRIRVVLYEYDPIAFAAHMERVQRAHARTDTTRSVRRHVNSDIYVSVRDVFNVVLCIICGVYDAV